MSGNNLRRSGLDTGELERKYFIMSIVTEISPTSTLRSVTITTSTFKALDTFSWVFSVGS